MIRNSVLTLLAIVLFTSAGCGFDIFPPTVKPTGPATDRYKIEFEYVPDAQLVTEDISPVWKLGRHAFKRGTDRLLVISRTTSFSDKDDKYNVIPGTLRDRLRERAWITIPGDIPIGKAVKLEELEREFMTGFDVNNLDGKGPLNSTALLEGYIVITSMTEKEIVVKMHIVVRPSTPFLGKDWHIEGEKTITIYPNGHYATHTVSRDIAVVVKDPEPGVVPVAPKPDQQSNQDADDKNATSSKGADDGKTADAGDKTGDKGADKNAGTQNNAGVKSVVVAEFQEKDIVGRWRVNTPQYDYRLQLEVNGTFILATTRGDGVNDDYEPGMSYGDYSLKKSKTANWLVLDTKAYYFGKSNHDKDIDGPMLLKVKLQKGELALTGKIRGKSTVHIVLKTGTYEDMHFILPPKGRRNIRGERNTYKFPTKAQASDN